MRVATWPVVIVVHSLCAGYVFRTHSFSNNLFVYCCWGCRKLYSLCWNSTQFDSKHTDSLQRIRKSKNNDHSKVFACVACNARPQQTSMQAVRRILIASNGMAAAKSIMSMRQWRGIAFDVRCLKGLPGCVSCSLVIHLLLITTITW